MTLQHIANLTNGLACAPEGAVMARIQSTACEQKRWAALIGSFPDHALFWVAIGESVVVHDQSERARMTRAQWQGLSFIRYAIRRSWHLEELPEITRSRGVVNNYWARAYGDLRKPDLSRLKYFRKYLTADEIGLSACTCPRIEWRES